MAALPAHLVATPVLERLTGRVGGRVLGTGATAAWVDLDGFVVAVTTREAPLLPGLAAGTRARLAPGRVDLGALQVTWDPAAPPSWDPTVRIPRAVGPEAIAGRAAALRGAVGAVDSHGTSPPERATLDPLFRAVRGRDPALAAGAARGLLGRGPGLTPEGDDLL